MGLGFIPSTVCQGLRVRAIGPALGSGPGFWFSGLGFRVSVGCMAGVSACVFLLVPRVKLRSFESGMWGFWFRMLNTAPPLPQLFS